MTTLEKHIDATLRAESARLTTALHAAIAAARSTREAECDKHSLGSVFVVAAVRDNGPLPADPTFAAWSAAHAAEKAAVAAAHAAYGPQIDAIQRELDRRWRVG